MNSVVYQPRLCSNKACNRPACRTEWALIRLLVRLGVLSLKGGYIGNFVYSTEKADKCL